MAEYADSARDYIYNSRYEGLLGRYNTPQEKSHLRALVFAEKGLNQANPSELLATISKDLTGYVQKLPEAERQSLLKQIAAVHSSADVYAIVDQLVPESDDDPEGWPSPKSGKQ